MLDPEFLRSPPDWLKDHLAARGYALDTDKLLSLDKDRRTRQAEVETLRAERNQLAKETGIALKQGGSADELKAKNTQLGKQLKDAETQLAEIQKKWQAWISEIPNLPAEGVPLGRDEADNQVVRKVGEPPAFEFEARDHVALGSPGGGMDFATAARLAGSRFVLLTGQIAALHRALAQFMLDLHVREHDYLEVNTPLLLGADAMFGTGQLPKFAEDQFSTREDPPTYLIPTAEVPLTNLAAGQILEADALPMRRVCHSVCFRREAGSYGKDTHGMLRQHQFEKVELVQIVKPEESDAALENMLENAETVLQKLQLPYRVVLLCSGDMGFSAQKTFDLEVWLPGQQAYREISSVSNCGDFQARRMQARWRDPAAKRPQFVHTLNGSGVAVGRALIAVLENHQTAGGDIRIPKALQPYLQGRELLGLNPVT